MAEVFKVEQSKVAGVEAEAGQKRYVDLQKALGSDVFKKEVDEADRILKDAADKITNADAKNKIDGYKKDISGYLVRVAENGRDALAKEKGAGAGEIESITALSEALKLTIDTAKNYVPVFLGVENSISAGRKIEPAMKKVREMDKSVPPLTPRQKHDLLAGAEEAIQNAADPLAGWADGSKLPPEIRQVFDTAYRPLKEAQTEFGSYRLDNMSANEAMDSPELVNLKMARNIFNDEQPNFRKIAELSNLVTTNTALTPADRAARIKELRDCVETDNLSEALHFLKQVDRTKIQNVDVDYASLYESLEAKLILQIRLVADANHYLKTKETVDGLNADERDCVNFSIDGIVTKTKKFDRLPPEKQQAIEMKLQQLQKIKSDIILEIIEKTADASDEQMLDGSKKLKAGDWAGAKQELLAYYKKEAANAEKADRVAEVKTMLQGIAKFEIKQSTDRLLVIKTTQESRFNNNLGRRDTGTLTHQQDEEFIESMSRVLAKAEEMIDAGEVLTLEEAEAKLRTMKAGSLESVQAAAGAKEKVEKLSDGEVKNKQEESLRYLADQVKSLQETIKRGMTRPDEIGLDGRPLSANLDFQRRNFAVLQSQLEATRNLKPEEYRKLLENTAELNLRQAKLGQALRVFNGGFAVDGRGNNAAGTFDMFRQQRMLNDPDPVRRKQNTLKLAQEARAHGLPELSGQLYESYFQKEMDEQSKNVSRDQVREKFLKDKDKMKKIDESLKQWEDLFVEKQKRRPTDEETAQAKQAMVEEMVGSAYTKAVKLKIHESFAGGTGDRAKAWNDVYGGVVALQDFGQGGVTAIFTDEEWNALPVKIAMMTSITIASMGVASAAEAGAGAVVRGIYGEAAIGSLVGVAVTTESGAVATIGGTALGRGLARLGGAVVEGVAFGTTQGALNYAIQGDKSTFASPGAYLEAMGKSIVTLGLLKGVGAGFGKLQQAAALRGAAGMTEEALMRATYMPKGLGTAAGEAGWWAGRTSAEGAALTGMGAAEAWMTGQEYSTRAALKSFGENFLYSAAIMGTHSFVGGGGHEEGGLKAEAAKGELAKRVVPETNSTPAIEGAAGARIETTEIPEHAENVEDNPPPTLRERHSDIDFSKLDNASVEKVLNSNEYTPKELMAALKQIPELKRLFEADSDVKEHYSIEQHTEWVMKQFDKYFAGKPMPPGVDVNFFRTLLAVHDIGKPLAVEKWHNKDLQHQETEPIVRDLLAQLGMDQKKIDLAAAILSGDPLGKMLQGIIDRKDSMVWVETMAGRAGIPAPQYLDVLLMFYKSDASAYTSDAGAKPSLDPMFSFDRAKGEMNFSPEHQIFMDEFKEEVHERAKVNKQGEDMRAELADYNKELAEKYKGIDFNLPENKQTIEALKRHLEISRELLFLSGHNKNYAKSFHLENMSPVEHEAAVARIKKAVDYYEKAYKLKQYDPPLAERFENINLAVDDLDLSLKSLNERLEYVFTNKILDIKRTMALLPPAERANFEQICGDNDRAILEYFNASENWSDAAQKALSEGISLDQSTTFSTIRKFELFTKINENISRYKRGALTPEERSVSPDSGYWKDLAKESMEMLKDGHIGSDYSHGTNSKVWNGLEKSGGVMLSAAELIRRNIKQESGEGLIGGGTLNDIVYAGKGLDGVGVAVAYGKVFRSVEGYRDPVHMEPAVLANKINLYQRLLAEMKKRGVTDASDFDEVKPFAKGFKGIIPGFQEKALKGELDKMREAQARRANFDLSEPYQIIFNFRDPGSHAQKIARTYAGGLSGEMAIHVSSIALADHLESVFVPKADIADARDRLVRIFGPEKGNAIKIYSDESVNMVSEMGGGLFKDTRDASYEALKGSQEGRKYIMEKIINFSPPETAPKAAPKPKPPPLVNKGQRQGDVAML